MTSVMFLSLLITHDYEFLDLVEKSLVGSV